MPLLWSTAPTAAHRLVSAAAGRGPLVTSPQISAQWAAAEKCLWEL